MERVEFSAVAPDADELKLHVNILNGLKIVLDYIKNTKQIWRSTCFQVYTFPNDGDEQSKKGH